MFSLAEIRLDYGLPQESRKETSAPRGDASFIRLQCSSGVFVAITTWRARCLSGRNRKSNNHMIHIIYTSPTRFLSISLHSHPCAYENYVSPKRVCWQPRLWHDVSSASPHTITGPQVCICINNKLAARRDSSSLISMQTSWRKAKRSFLSITQTPGKPAHRPPRATIETLTLLTRTF